MPLKLTKLPISIHDQLKALDLPGISIVSILDIHAIFYLCLFVCFFYKARWRGRGGYLI